MQDVLEELLQAEIVDETDRYVDNMHSERVNAALLRRSLPPHLRRVLSTRTLLPRIGGASFMERTAASGNGGLEGAAGGWGAAVSSPRSVAGRMRGELAKSQAALAAVAAAAKDAERRGATTSAGAEITIQATSSGPTLMVSQSSLPDRAALPAAGAAMSSREGSARGPAGLGRSRARSRSRTPPPAVRRSTNIQDQIAGIQGEAARVDLAQPLLDRRVTWGVADGAGAQRRTQSSYMHDSSDSDF